MDMDMDMDMDTPWPLARVGDNVRIEKPRDGGSDPQRYNPSTVLRARGCTALHDYTIRHSRALSSVSTPSARSSTCRSSAL
eukprot:scaffold12872_cov93-Phaeocystis_antarctica.AAC.2